jgi:hypothetical protein
MNSPFDRIAPEVVRQALPRRVALRRLGQAGLALAALPVLRITNTALAQTGQRLGGGDDPVGVLNFALTLEYLEESFYRQGLDAGGLIPSADRPVFDQIQKHEEAHVDFLRTTINSLGGTPVAFSDGDFDFTGGDGSGNGPYNPFDDYEIFLALSQGFEDTGVRAYKGQATALMDEDDLLLAALRIHSVEARHASQVRRMRQFNGMEVEGWIPFDQSQLPAGFEDIYAGEGNLTHGGVNVSSVSNVADEEITEAFDEPLTMDAVLAIVDPFVDG